MDHIQAAAEVLEQAEISLRAIVAKAVDSGDYQTVVEIASWASTITDMLRKAGRKHAHHATPVTFHVAPKRKSARAKKDSGYPKFFRQGDQLIRVAWSNRERNEYQHKTGYSVVQAVVLAMARSGENGRVFSTEDCLPVQDAEGGGDVPSYQAYIVISLLKQAGLIEQHGRKGYSIPREAEFRDAVEALWKKLPNR